MQQLKQWFPAMTGMACMGLGGGLIGVYGFFAEHLSREFNVGVATINLGPVALLLVPGIMGPIIGRFVDKVPIRHIMLTGVTIAMAGLGLASVAGSLWVAALGFMIFALGLSMYGPVVVNGLLIKLYRGREARALAIAAMGMSVSTAILPPLVALLLAGLDWREALAALAVGILVLVWAVVLLGIPANAGSSVAKAESETKPTSIYRQPSFWLVGFCVALALNVAIVLAVSYPAHFTAAGFTVTEAGFFIAVAGSAGLCGKGLIAVFAEFVGRHTKGVAMGLLLGQATGLFLLLQAGNTTEVILMMIWLGACSGAFIPMHPYLNSCYFDSSVIGEVNGAQMPLFLPFGFIGAPLAGYLFDQQGNYDMAFTGLCAVLVVAALFAFALPRVTKNTPSALL